MRYPNPAMLVYIASAEAHLRAQRNFSPPGYGAATQLSMANAEVLLSAGAAELITHRKIHELFAQSMVNTFEEDQRKGKGNLYPEDLADMLAHSRDGQELMSKLTSKSISSRSGPWIGAVPFGVLRAPYLVLRLTEKYATLTHDSWRGVTAAQIIALMAHYALYEKGNFDRLYDFGVRRLPDFREVKQPLELNSDDENDGGRSGLNVARQVFQLLTKEKKGERGLGYILEQAQRCDGNIEVIGALAWGIASTRYRSEQLPKFLVSHLNEHEGGQLQKLGQNLMEQYQ